MNKLELQKSIAQLYIDIYDYKQKVLKKNMILSFEEQFNSFYNKTSNFNKELFLEEFNNFQNQLITKKNILLEEYKDLDLDKYIFSKAKEYFIITHDYIKNNPFYDATITIIPTWEEDYIKVKQIIKYLSENKHLKIINEIIYEQEKSSLMYATIDLATDIYTAFEINHYIQKNSVSCQIQNHFLGIDPSHILTFENSEYQDNYTTTLSKSHLMLKVIAYINKGHLMTYDSPDNILFMLLNDSPIPHLHYNFHKNNGENTVSLTDAANNFLNNKY